MEVKFRTIVSLIAFVRGSLAALYDKAVQAEWA